MASIKDVAELAKVSISSVSLAINYPERVREGTKTKIFDAMKKLHYVPSSSSKSALEQTQKRNSVALITGEIFGPYYYEVTSDSPWNFCLPKANVRPEAVAESFVVEDDGEMAPYPWTLDGSPVKIRTRANRLGDWTLYSGSAGPIAFVSSQRMYMSPEEEWIELIHGVSRALIRPADFRKCKSPLPEILPTGVKSAGFTTKRL